MQMTESEIRRDYAGAKNKSMQIGILADELSKCKPFCLPMPITKSCVEEYKMQVIDSPQLLEV